MRSVAAWVAVFIPAFLSPYLEMNVLYVSTGVPGTPI